MNSILVVDDQAIFREPIAAALRLHGYKAMVASSGKEALDIISGAAPAPALIILDLVMPEIDGWEVLQQIRQNEQFQNLPVLLLTGNVDRGLVVRARNLGVSEYLLKEQFSFGAMLERLEKHLGRSQARTTVPAAASASSPALTRQALIAAIESRAPARLAGAVAKVITIAGSPNSQATDLVGVLKGDPVLASRVLQAANAAALATQKVHVASLEEAVRNLGFRAVGNIAGTIGIFEAFATTAPAAVELQRCWQHSIAVATIMDRLVGAATEKQGLAYLVGLCHDLWEIALRQWFPREFAAALDRAAGTAQPLRHACLTSFGITRDELAGLLLAKAGLPGTIVAPIREFFQDSTDASGNPLAQALKLANNYASGLLLVSGAHELVGPITQRDWQRVADGHPEIAFDDVALRAEVAQTTASLGQLPPFAETALIQPVLSRVEGEIWYLRHSSLACFDPLASALALLSSIRLVGDPTGDLSHLRGQVGIVAARDAADAAALLSRLDGVKNTAAAAPLLCLCGGVLPPGLSHRAGIEFAAHPISLAALHRFVGRALAATNIGEPDDATHQAA